MDQQIVNEFTDILKNVFRTKRSQRFNNGIFLEFIDGHRSNCTPELLTVLEHFDEVSNVNIARNGQPAIVLSKSRISLSSTSKNSNSVIMNGDASNVSLRNKSERESKTSSASSSVSGSGDAILSGSPLRVETFADLSMSDLDSPFEEVSNHFSDTSTAKQFVGLDLQEARHFISMYTISCKNILSLSNNGNGSVIPSLWVLCQPRKMSDPVTTLSTIMLGAEPVEKQNRVQPQKNLKLIKVSLSQKSTEQVDCHSYPFPSNTSEVTCQAVYDVLENQKHFNEGYTGILKVLVEWKNVRRLLQKFPTDADATIVSSISSGCEQSPVFSLYSELKMLKNIIGATETGNIVWLAGDREHSLLKSVENLVEYLKQNDADDVDDGAVQDSADEDECCAVNLNMEERLDLDFTDRLWKVLLRCQSMSELTESLQYVLSCLRGGEIQPFVRNSNHTRLATLVRQSYTSEMEAPSLRGVAPLTMMADIGIEKLQGDYMTYLVSKDLTTPSSLTSYLSKDADCQSKINKLESLHAVLEMVMMFKMFLPLPFPVMAAIVKQMLQHFEDNPVIEDGHTFNFPVSATAVQSALSSLMPCTWKAELVEGLSKSNLCFLSTSKPFHQLQGTNDDDAEEDSETEDHTKISYFMLVKEETVV